MTNALYIGIGPIIALTLGVVILLMVEVTLHPPTRVWRLISFGALIAGFILAIVQWADAANTPQPIFSHMLMHDGFWAFGSIVLIIVAALGLLVAWPLVEADKARGAELVALVLLATIGLILLVGAANLIMVFLGLEVASISLYVIAGFIRRGARSNEAAVKYFLLGSFSSAVFLYGVALVYAATGTLEITAFAGPGFSGPVESPILLVGIGLIVVGLGFKVSAAPFHMWAPDVYQGSASGVTGFMNAGAKIAGFAALARILVISFDGQRGDWGPALAVIAALSMIVGTVLAITQTDIKRMLAYSSVAHAGFIMTALVSGGAGIDALWFYVVTYAFQVVGAFGVVAAISGVASGESSLTSYVGLGRRSPFLAGVLSLMMLAMAGIPLTAGFAGKFGVFRAALEAGYTWLVVLALVASAVGLYFYLRVIVRVYIDEDAGDQPRVVITDGMRFALTTVAVLTVAFGVNPAPLLTVVANALPF
ncbi:MAG: NADH-quinone oxidoreductase subunit N [Acidimicrobiia bacterium]|nr:NADH-quinone oxidoreductase subunit N [Acidimicrobiia bacterium]